ncbi:MAG: O-antigen ligase family protein [Hyphomicrobiaceae bacterium]|nr:O-antigen ligase family protein [Hyphomicrobiaceae bacterium]
MELGWRQWLGGAALFAVLLVVYVSPRGAATVVVGLLIVALAEPFLRGRRPDWPDFSNRTLTAWLAFAGMAALSSLWSATPVASLLKPLYLAIAILAAWYAAGAIARLSDRQIGFLGEAIALTAAVAAVLVSIEIMTDQAINRAVLTAFPDLREDIAKHVRVVDGVVERLSATNLNRRTAVIAWMLWPALLIAAHDGNRLRGRIVTGLVAAGALVILAEGSHQSSQLAIALSALVFAAAKLAPEVTWRGLAALWIAATLLVVPAVHVAFKARLHEAPWLFHSAKHRVVIWGFAAEEIMEAPLIGVGADATRKAMKVAATEEGEREDLGYFKSAYADHAHNVYLQVWYELGVVGAGLFLVAGLAVLWAVSALSPAAQPFGLATFALTAGLIGFSYSLWQPWFMATPILAIAALMIGDRMARSPQGGKQGKAQTSSTPRLWLGA